MSGMDLATFLRARLTEDEQAAREAHGYGWDTDAEDASNSWILTEDMHLCLVPNPSAEHIARHDPTRVFSDVQAKRRILALHDKLPDKWDYSTTGYVCRLCNVGWAPARYSPWPCDTLRLLALPYADHPDYRPEWRA